MANPTGYIDLNRRFRLLYGSVQTDPDNAAGSSYLRGAFAGATLVGMNC
jgi:hypothetical protein